MHFILGLKFDLLLKLIADQLTDIVTYRASIAAKDQKTLYSLIVLFISYTYLVHYEKV
jgi:hypothetical protein